jgi:hypothetical protein
MRGERMPQRKRPGGIYTLRSEDLEEVAATGVNRGDSDSLFDEFYDLRSYLNYLSRWG